MWKTASIPQRPRQAQADPLNYLDDLNPEMVRNAVEMVQRGSPDEKILRNLADTWMLSTKTANLVLQQAKAEFTKPALEVGAMRKTAQAVETPAAVKYRKADEADLQADRHCEDCVHYTLQPGRGSSMVGDCAILGQQVGGDYICDRFATKHTAQYDEDFDDQAEAYCPMCGGPGVPLGQLGHLMHYRCRNCGMQFNHDVSEQPGENIQDRLPRHMEPLASRTAQNDTSEGPPPGSSADNPIVKTTGPSLKDLKRRSPQVPEEVSVEAPDLPHQFEALAASMNDLNAQIQAMDDEEKRQVAELKDKLKNWKTGQGFDELVKQRQADIVALYDGLQELDENADMVARRFNQLVLVAVEKSTPDPLPPSAAAELKEVYERLKGIEGNAYKNIKAQMDRWRVKNSQFIEKVTKELMQFPQTEPQRKRQPERGARRAQLLGGLLETIGSWVNSAYQGIMGVIQDLTGVQAELDDVEQQLQGLQVTAGQVVRALRVADEVLVDVQALNQYSLPAISGAHKALRGSITAAAKDGCYVKLADGQRFVRWDSIVGGPHG